MWLLTYATMPSNGNGKNSPAMSGGANPELKRNCLWTRRRLVVASAFAIAFLGSVLALINARYPPGDYFDREVYGRIKLGMTEQQVHEVVRWAPGDYANAGGGIDIEDFNEGPGPFWKRPATAYVQEWYGSKYAIFVYYDEKGVVISKRLYIIIGAFDDSRLSLVQRVGVWLGIQRRQKLLF
jgi:hypothetical protein